VPFDDFAAWRRELLAAGNLVQDGDGSASAEEAGRRFDRYVALADMIDGTEGPEAVHALVASLRAEEDYGAHEAVYGALERFPSKDLVNGIILAVDDLLRIPRDHSGQVLQLLALLSDADDLQAFTAGCGRLTPDARSGLAGLIESHEANEWLADERCLGRLRLGPVSTLTARISPATSRNR
jgi:hypothetical protein